MLRDQRVEQQVVHLTTVGLCGLKLIANRRDVVVEHWVAALSHSGLSYGVFVNLQRLLMQFLTPIIRLTQESFRLLFKVPQLVSDVSTFKSASFRKKLWPLKYSFIELLVSGVVLVRTWEEPKMSSSPMKNFTM